MTGCATATGDARGDAGLLGLTRAWLIAGASATIATESARFQIRRATCFPCFIATGRLPPRPRRCAAARWTCFASGGGKSAPSYWAAYQVTGGER